MLKKYNHYFIQSLVIGSLILCVLPTLVQAQTGSLLKNTSDAGTSAGFDTDTPTTSLARIVGIVVQTFLSLIGVLFISYAVYGGFLWMTAAGNDEKVTKAKDILRNGIIGMIVIFSAAAIYYAAVAIFDPQFSDIGNF